MFATIQHGKMQRMWICSFVLLLAVLVSACTHTKGPEIVVHSHLDYNKAVAQVVNEELLLNIVRRRYYEPPQFVSVSSISTQVTTSGNVGADVTVAGSGFSNAGASGGMTFTDAPTITITPEKGKSIAGPLTKRMSCMTLGKLANAGYRFDLLLALMVANITDIRGPQVGLGSDFRPGSTNYVEVIERIRALIDSNQLLAGTFLFNDPYSSLTLTAEEITLDDQLAAVAIGGGTARYRSFDDGKTYSLTNKKMYPAMWMEESARESEEGKRVLELLNLNQDPLKKIWIFKESKVIYGAPLNWEKNEARNEVRVQMRSFYSMLNFLSYGVRVPSQHEAQSRVFSKEHYDRAVKAGRALDASEYFVVYWSKKRPEDSFVSVFHHGVWFYIKNTDHHSKRIFNALYDLYNLEVVPDKEDGGPMLTLPVG
jgi:hypothetical protein